MRRVSVPAQTWFHAPAAGGVVLLAATLLALLLANSPWSDAYFSTLHRELSVDLGVVHGRATVLDWINEGAMAVFFLLVGVEIKQALTSGELASVRRAALPVLVAFGGALVPAAVYLGFTWGTSDMRGWAIPIATDIAFALGVLSAIRGIPRSMRAATLGYATADDVIGVIVIAAFYSSSLDGWMLAATAIALAMFWGFRTLHPRTSGTTVLLGLLVWFAMLKSGIHAAVAGVPLGLLLGARAKSRSELAMELGGLHDRYAAASVQDQAACEMLEGELEEIGGGTESPAARAERRLRPWVTFLVVPAFALANAGVILDGDAVRAALHARAALGTFFGLAVGAPAGVLLALWLGNRRSWAAELVSHGRVAVLGFATLSGIGFTVALFIAELAFEGDPYELNAIKVAILAASALDAVIGTVLLRRAVRVRAQDLVGSAASAPPAHRGSASELTRDLHTGARGHPASDGRARGEE